MGTFVVFFLCSFKCKTFSWEGEAVFRVQASLPEGCESCTKVVVIARYPFVHISVCVCV